MSNEEYNQIRENPVLSSKKFIEDSLDKMIEKAATVKAEPKPTVTAHKTIPNPPPRNASQLAQKSELAKLREQVQKTKSLDSFTPPTKTKKTVEQKDVGAIKPKGLNIPDKTSSKKSSKKPSK